MEVAEPRRVSLLQDGVAVRNTLGDLLQWAEEVHACGDVDAASVLVAADCEARVRHVAAPMGAWLFRRGEEARALVDPGGNGSRPQATVLWRGNVSDAFWGDLLGLTKGGTVAPVAARPPEEPGPRVLSFPQRVRFGSLHVRPRGSRETWSYQGPAIGQAIVPQDVDVRLVVDPAASSLSPLGALPPDALHSVEVSRRRIGETETGLIAGQSGLRELSLDRVSVTSAALACLGNLEAFHMRGGDLRDLSVLERLTGLKALSVTRYVRGERSLAFLEKLPGLESLDVSRTLTDDETLYHVGKLRRLRELRLSHTRVTWLDGVRGLESLEVLDVSHAPIVPYRLYVLMDLPLLHTLRLSPDQVQVSYLLDVPNLLTIQVDGAEGDVKPEAMTPCPFRIAFVPTEDDAEKAVDLWAEDLHPSLLTLDSVASAILQAMSHPQQQVVQRQVVDGQTAAETASELGIAPTEVRQILNAAWEEVYTFQEAALRLLGSLTSMLESVPSFVHERVVEQVTRATSLRAAMIALWAAGLFKGAGGFGKARIWRDEFLIRGSETDVRKVLRQLREELSMTTSARCSLAWVENLVRETIPLDADAASLERLLAVELSLAVDADGMIDLLPILEGEARLSVLLEEAGGVRNLSWVADQWLARGWPPPGRGKVAERATLERKLIALAERTGPVFSCGKKAFMHRTALPILPARLEEIVEWCVRRVEGEGAVKVATLLSELSSTPLAHPALDAALLKDALIRHLEILNVSRHEVAHVLGFELTRGVE